LLTAPGSPYNNYDKRDFKSTVQSLSAETYTTHLLDEAGKAKLKKAMGGKALERITPISTEYPDIVALTTTTQELLKRSVTSQIIESLAANPAIAAWVGTGLQLHTGEHVSDACHFCGQTLPAERLRHLEAHFNDEFKKFQDDIAAAGAAVDRARDSIRGVNAPDMRLLYDHLREDLSKATGALISHRGNALLYLDALSRALEEKKASPFKPLDLLPYVGGSTSSTEPKSMLSAIFFAVLSGAATLSVVLGKDAVTKINGVIEAHNARTENFNGEVAKARKSLERCFAAEVFEKYQAQASLIKTTRTATEENDAAIKVTKETIAALEAEIRQHHRPASELTAEIQAYLGRDELALVSSDTGYGITRYGQPASNLSEGERTAIAFLYFLKSLRDTSFDMKTGIVVIDDPVSSLDANALFSAFGYLQDRTKDAGQLLVLTHNFAFFRLVKNWFNKQPGQNKGDITKRPSRFYMLVAARHGDRRTAALAPLDPLLHEFESEYHYLFKRVYEEANRPDHQIGLAENYGMPNITRRLLEAFLAFRGSW
jgi:wobble nucleotide-excising tRNase